MTKKNEPNALEEAFGEPDVKLILLGDSAVGKSKLVERYLQDNYDPRRLSTHALTLYRKNITLGDDSRGENRSLGHSWSRKVQLDAPVILLQGTCMHFGI